MASSVEQLVDRIDKLLQEVESVRTALSDLKEKVNRIKADVVHRTGLDNHDYVDLGLPSGTLWATCNVGANAPEEYGDYFAWGETTPKSNYDWRTYKYYSEHNGLTKYCHNSDYGKNWFTDNKTILDAEDDAATANWGNGWRMPTLEEIEELYNKCSSIWTTQNGKNGRLFTGPNGNTLFLPAAGDYTRTSNFFAGSSCHYWSSTLDDDYPDPNIVYNLYFDSDFVDGCYDGRCDGFSVRPVVRLENLR